MLARLFGSAFWIPAYVALIAGFVVPGDLTALKPLVPVLLGGILFCSSLKFGLGEVRAAFVEPGALPRLGALIALKLLVLPLIPYAATLAIAPEWAPGVLLVGMMPGGLSSLAFADLYGGDRGVALLLLLGASLLCPLTAPAMLHLFGIGQHGPGQPSEVALFAKQALYIVLLLGTPFTLAQVVRGAAPRFVERNLHRLSPAAIACLCLLITVSIAGNRQAWAGWTAQRMLAPLLLVCAASCYFILASRLMRVWLGRERGVSMACSTVYMNNGLSLAVAIQFFPGDAHLLLPSVLMQVPMVIGVMLAARWVGMRGRVGEVGGNSGEGAA